MSDSFGVRQCKKILNGGLVAIALSAFSITALAGDQNSDAGEWLMRINEAAAELSFAGNFVYIHDNEVEAMEVIRRVTRGHMQERLFALNGEAREVVRDQDRVWCYIPDKNMGVHDYRQATGSGFPKILPNDLNDLKKNYDFSLGETLRIAKRMAQKVKVIPKDTYRYGYNLWADVETGLLLRSDLVDHHGEIVEQYLFVDIEIGIDIKDSELESVTNKDQLVWFGMDRPNLTAKVDRQQWFIENPPAGFQLTKHIRRMTPMEMEEEEHLVFTDGLSSVSVFVKKARKGQSNMVGLSRMGAVHAYRDTMRDHWITVMGEVPAETVTALAAEIAYRP
ncbi:MAG: MucB/RseB C-terminal domain-containing protein [Acidiferrobacterales bacterium]|nr:MucB/RseB C-terminal domain-containing protein [Acidiferrobacterales bacterium]